MDHPLIRTIARSHALHPAQVCLKWAVQRGHIPIPFSVKTAQHQANLDAVSGVMLSESEMSALTAVNCDNRLIKGQVFLWDGARDWTELWDEAPG